MQGWLHYSSANDQDRHDRLAVMGQMRSDDRSRRSHDELIDRLDRGNLTSFPSIEGEFCAAHVDRNGETATLYRSITSPWPLYYRLTSNALVWSTDPTFTYPRDEIGKFIDSDSLPSLLFQSRYDSYMRDVSLVEPGQAVELTPTGLRKTYLDQIYLQNPTGASIDEVARDLEEHVSRAVGSLGQQGRTAVALSGGIDSSVVLSEAVRHSRDISAYHFTMQQSDVRADLASARQAAKEYSANLVEVDLSDLTGPDGAYVLCGKECVAYHPHLGPERALLRAAADSSHSPVSMLTGLLSDDLFGGAAADCISFNPLSLDTVWNGARRLIAARSRFGRRIARSVARGIMRPSFGILPITLPYLETFGGSLIPDEAREEAVLHSLDSAKKVEERLHGGQVQFSRSDRLRASALSVVALEMNSLVIGSAIQEREIPSSSAWLMPFADRRLVEYCLSIPHEYRSGEVMGDRIEKLIWRYAFLSRAPKAAVRQQLGNVINIANNAFVENNVGPISSILNSDSLLHAAGALDGNEAVKVLRNPILRANYGSGLLQAYRMECWLRRL
ncbi:asparagine synthase-related protein [Mangrovactinospora gilvigrisea]|uniref:asparagine synthase-related protein n=1 Tax=Mangrovactinospora gilvigrisea TaxID=1428644 RepID=UPI001587D5F0|nr:asparagine synthase C-terminal domain-containing protein [Mangrovactinospora gilvigrisea]